MRPDLAKPLEKLTKAGALPEPQVQSALERVLETYGEVIPQHQTGDGPCDLFLPARRVVIEVKERAGKRKAAAVGPDLPGSQPGETQHQQLERYVRALREKERRSLWGDLPDVNTPWIGALTDGVRWWAWEWPANRDDEFVREYAPLHEQLFLEGGGGTPQGSRSACHAQRGQRVGAAAPGRSVQNRSGTADRNLERR